MRSDGTPIAILNGSSSALDRQQIGGRDGRHDERWLQALLHRHPTCLPMSQIEPGLSRLVPVCMELPLASGSLDNLFLTPDGDIVIVEAKLWRNPEARREVVAQALDYANSLFGMDYAALEAAVLRADFGCGETPRRLYDLFSDADTLDEPDFVDAITMNLKNGRIVVLVAGDGIRTGAENLVQGLQSHAGFHFTFALVELSVFQNTKDDGLLIIPRTLLKTCMVERGVVRIEDGRTEVIAIPPQTNASTPINKQSITSEQFYDAMRERDAQLPDAIMTFVDQLAELGVYPEFKRSLNLKWDTRSGKAINLGYVLRNGQLWTDATTWSGANADATQSYLSGLAKAMGGNVLTRETNENSYVIVDGKPPLIDDAIMHADEWYDAILRLQKRLHARNAEN